MANYFKVGDPILFGKYKNKPGIIVRFFKDGRGLPYVEVEPVPKGRKKNREIGLFNIWHQDASKRASALAHRKQAEMTHAASVALMKWLSQVTRRMGIAQDVYVVGGAVRNFLIGEPIKDIDMVVDAQALRGNRDSAWVAQQIARRIPAPTDIVTDALMVSKVQIKGSWILDGHEMEGNDIEIVNAREEVYEQDEEGNYLGHKPIEVLQTDLETDVTRREFTFNTLMWSLLSLANGPEKAEIVDITGCGMRDLKNREMRCPQDPDLTFKQDPTRILRTIKFAFKYGFKLPPDVKAAAKRQAKGLKRIPSKTWSVLQKIVLDNSQYKKALDAMEDLGVTDVIAEIIQEDRQFASTISNYTMKRGVGYMFDLMDMGIPVGSAISFLSGSEQKRFRQITAPMERDEALFFLEVVKNPGKGYKNKKFIPQLAASKGYGGKHMRNFMVPLNSLVRGEVLERPDLAFNPQALMREAEKLSRQIPDNTNTRKASVYKPMSEIDPATQEDLDSPTPAWLQREYPYVAPPNKAKTLNELDYLISLMPMRSEWEPFIRKADEDIGGLFFTLCSELGVPCDVEVLAQKVQDLRILITKLKWLYNRPRPYQVAIEENRFAGQGDIWKPGDFSVMPSVSAHTPAYPSGHTIQAYVLASYLSGIAPQHRHAFMHLANKISFSRAVAGYHWPSDLVFGQDIFRHIINAQMPASVRLGKARYKNKREVPKADGNGTSTVYEYGPRQVQNRNRAKAERVERLRTTIGELRKQVRKDLKSEDPKVRLAALAVALIDQTYERVGNEKSASENGHHGITTLTTDHIKMGKDKATLSYVGKSGVEHTKTVTDKATLTALKKALTGRGKGDRVLCDGGDCTIRARDVNAYLRDFDITAKDLRGMHANEEMRSKLTQIRKKGPALPRERKERDKILKAEFKEALEGTAEAVGHKASTLKSQYLVPGMEDAFLKDGTVIDKLHKKAAKKYEHIDFKPPKSVADAAKKGLELREKASPSNRGGLTTEQAGQMGIGSGVQRAVNLKNRNTLTPATIKKMNGFFSRHEQNKNIAPENKGKPWNDKGYVSWLLWGGDPGKSWAAKILKQMEAADEKAKKKASLSERWGSTLVEASENEPTNPGLWAKVQALAKGEQASFTHDGKTINGPNDGKGFKIFPSAYANGWASKVYGDLGGGWKKKARGKAKKDVGHGGLDEWFSGHGGAKGKGEEATWGDWVAISPVKKTLDSGRKVEPGDIVGPCGISKDPDWKDVTDGGEDPLKCMPRDKAHDMPKKERAEKAKAKQKAEKADSSTSKKPTNTPTFEKKKASLEEQWGAMAIEAPRVGTKSDAEKEDEEAQRLVRNSPKNKPPRKDLERSRIKDHKDEDPDEKQDRKDRSLNFKDIAARMQVRRVAHRFAKEMTEQEWETYKEEHPGADKSDHTIVKVEDSGEGGESTDEMPKVPEDLSNEKAIKDYAKGVAGVKGAPLDADAIEEVVMEVVTSEGDSSAEAVEKAVVEALEKASMEKDEAAKAEAIEKVEAEVEELFENLDHLNDSLSTGDVSSGSVGDFTPEQLKTFSNTFGATSAQLGEKDSEVRSNPKARARLQKKVDGYRKLLESSDSDGDRLKEDPKKFAEALATVDYYERVLNNPLVVPDNPIPAKSGKLSGKYLEEAKKKVPARAKETYARYQGVDAEARENAASVLQKEIAMLEEGSARRLELEGMVAGLNVLSAVEDEDSFQGGPATQQLAKALAASGNVGLLMSVAPTTVGDALAKQQELRSALGAVEDKQWSSVMSDDAPGAPIAELLGDDEAGQYLTEDDRAFLREVLQDEIMADVAVVDPIVATKAPNAGDGRSLMQSRGLPKQKKKVQKQLKEALEGEEFQSLMEGEGEENQEERKGFFGALLDLLLGSRKKTIETVKESDEVRKDGDTWNIGDRWYAKKDGETQGFSTEEGAKGFAKGAAINPLTRGYTFEVWDTVRVAKGQKSPLVHR